MKTSKLNPKKLIANKKTALSALLAGIIALPAAGDDLETIPPGEASAIEGISKRAIEELGRHYPDGSSPVRRDAHAKAHGCVKAQFRVDPDIPEDLQVGVFSEPGHVHRAWVRFSNGQMQPAADRIPDGRGMAVKLLNVDGPRLAAAPGFEGTQDFLMVNFPVFFVRDASDYLEFAENGALAGSSEGYRRFFAGSHNPFHWRWREAKNAISAAYSDMETPTEATYYSMTPYLYGEGRAVKFSARSCVTPPAGLDEAVNPDDPNYLREALRFSLDRKPACFAFMVQEQKAGMPVEDPTVRWDESESPFRRVATITIQPQRFDTTERDAACEDMAFNPWNGLAAHRPLGGINRVRRAVYETISGYRHQRNDKELNDPYQAW